MKRLIVLFATVLLAASLSAATPEQLFAAGKQAMGKNEWDKATDLFEQAVKARPDSAEYHFRLGQAYGSQAKDASIFRQPGLASKTREEFERAVQLDPNLIDARRLGQIYEKTGRKAEAKQSYATSLRLAPGAKDVTEALKRVS